MKRVAVLVLAATASVLVAGCLGEPEYNKRLETTLELMRYQKKLDENLAPAETSGFREKEVYVRAPLPLTRYPQFLIQVPPGAYDLAESFGGAPAGADGQAAGVPIALHVLARWKKPPRVAAKKGEPPPPAAPRGPFEQDVRSLLSAYYGNAEVPTAKAETVNARGRTYKRLRFNSGTGNNVRAYFYEGPNHYVALVLDVPAALASSTTATRGADLMLETLAVGNAARAAFEGRAEGAAASAGAAF